MAEPIATWAQLVSFSVEWMHAESLHQGNKGNEEFCRAPSASKAVHEPRRSRAGVSPRREAFGNLPRQFEEVFGEREHRAVQTVDLRIGGLDDIIFVRSMGAAPVAQPEMAGRELERFAGEQIAG